MPLPIEGGFAGVQDAFEPLPDGLYAAKVSDVATFNASDEAKYPGELNLKIEYTVTDEEYEGRKLFQNISFAPRAKGFLVSFLLGVGYSRDELDDPGFSVEEDDLLERECTLVVRKGKNPKTKEENNSVRRVLPAGSMPATSDLPTA